MSDNVAHALSGAGGGIISMAITYPLVAISSRFQVQNMNGSGKDEYKNTYDAFIKIFNREGLKGFYSGFASGIFGIAVTNGVYYYCYEAVKSIFLRKGSGKSITTPQSMVAGTVAGAAVVLATHPIWTVNTRMSVQRQTLSSKSKRPSTLQIALFILKREGILGLYAGATAAIVLVMNPIIQYAIFENLKTKLLASKSVLSGLDYFMLGAFSKLCATVIMYPYILVKSQLQMNNEQQQSILETMKKIVKQEGIAGLYSGLNSKLLQSVLSSAFLFYAKEVLFDWSVWILVVSGTRKSMQ